MVRERWVEITKQTLIGDCRPTFFVDVVDRMGANQSRTNMCSVDDLYSAAKIARQIAAQEKINRRWSVDLHR